MEDFPEENSGLYVGDAWNTYEQALSNAEEVLNNSSSTEEEITDAINELENAIASLDSAKALVQINGTGYSIINDAIEDAESGSTITFNENNVIDEALVVSGKELTFDLEDYKITNEKDLYNGNTETWSLLSVRNGGTVTINGNDNSEIESIANDCYAVDIKNGSSCIINGGSYVGNIDSVYVYEGSLIINDGEFSINQIYKKNTDSTCYEYTINCLDANYKNGTATASISGGRFYMFDPSDSKSENPNGNFVTEGHKVIQDGDWYEVVDE